MKTLFDSSAFAKRYIEEAGSQAVDDVCQRTTALALSVLCAPEIISALNRRVREKRLSRQDYFSAKSRLSADVADAVVIELTPDVVSRSIFLLETHDLRTLDAIHVACALEWGAEEFVSADERQVKAAHKSGLKTTFIEGFRAGPIPSPARRWRTP
ncbi:MAG: type II toxin-antitoxin system VapC family toxin [Verrucomicrobiota bacterium]|nr:type II toxin-antitoxin system VapC family toxin [Verrucomicrobiota bacterium]